jgi:hypothetical protein
MYSLLMIDTNQDFKIKVFKIKYYKYYIMGVCTSSCLNSNNKKHKNSQLSIKENIPVNIREIKAKKIRLSRRDETLPGDENLNNDNKPRKIKKNSCVSNNTQGKSKESTSELKQVSKPVMIDVNKYIGMIEAYEKTKQHIKN